MSLFQIFDYDSFELLQRPHDHVPRPDCLQSLLVGFLARRLAVPAVLQLDCQERVAVAGDEQHEVGEARAHAHGLELRRLVAPAEAAVGRVVKVGA